MQNDDVMARRTYCLVSMGLLAALATVILIALAAQRTQSSLMPLYLVPISLSTWLSGRLAGFLVALTSMISTLLPESAAIIDGAISPHVLTDGTAALLVFAGAAFWLSRLRTLLCTERTLAQTDFTTGARNRRYFYDTAAMEIRRFKRYRRTFTVAMLDLDNFKTVNDTQGHHAGDDVLRRVAQTLQANLRDTDTVARIGGDEFALLLPETDAADARTVLTSIHNRLLAAMRRHRYPVTVSIGVVTFEIPPATVGDILRHADQLLYQAKREGKNRIALQRYPVDGIRPSAERRSRPGNVAVSPAPHAEHRRP